MTVNIRHYGTYALQQKPLGKVDIEEFVYIIERDRKIASSLRKEKKKKSVQKVGEEMEGRLRDPGIGWILDFNNDGYVSVEVSITRSFYGIMLSTNAVSGKRFS